MVSTMKLTQYLEMSSSPHIAVRGMVLSCYYDIMCTGALLLQTFLGFHKRHNTISIVGHNFTLHISTEVYGSRILSSIYTYIYIYIYVSLSTVVLNSRDW